LNVVVDNDDDGGGCVDIDIGESGSPLLSNELDDDGGDDNEEDGDEGGNEEEEEEDDDDAIGVIRNVNFEGNESDFSKTVMIFVPFGSS